MFSKALFKQSMKANWVKWVSVTLSTCVMLAIVIIVLGNLGINDIRDSLKDVFTQADQESYLKENAVDGYELYLTSIELEGTLQSLDADMAQTAYGILINQYNTNKESYKTENNLEELDETALEEIRRNTATSIVTNPLIWGGITSQLGVSISQEQGIDFVMEIYRVYDNPEYTTAPTEPEFLTKFQNILRTSFLNYVYTSAYELNLSQEGSNDESATYSAEKMEELITNAMASYQVPEGEFDRTPYKESAMTGINNMLYDVTNYTYYNQLIAGGMEEEEATSTAEQYAVVVKVLSNTAISTYELWLDELGDVEGAQEQARTEACASITDQIPEKVSEALSELGNMDIYSLIIGSIFYRIAGLLLPMVFVIMTANGLLAGQVDSGSMAYVLSTPTKRRTVTVTQMTYLIVSLFAMFALLTVTSVIAVWISGGNSFAINYGQILLFNLGAFLTMFAIAGFCFMCSALFNRAKYSLGVGGGITIFSLVCTILGLFGSSVVPSAMRISAMNFFNYLSVITLYDTVSIMAGTLSYLWKFGILLAIGVVTFIIGVFRFDKKDLPL